MRFFSDIKEAVSEINRDMEEMGLKTTNNKHLLNYSFAVGEVLPTSKEDYKEHWETIDRFIENKLSWARSCAEHWDNVDDLDLHNLNQAASSSLFGLYNGKVKALIQLKIVSKDSLPLLILLYYQLATALAHQLNCIPSRPGIATVDSVSFQILVLKNE